ncbi:hypothetical protein HY620_02045 [Candidatus Uhrbacteria bacterium]|nr:hypothetical protein [Candidatus Uhrbacteria bacterium]
MAIPIPSFESSNHQPSPSPSMQPTAQPSPSPSFGRVLEPEDFEQIDRLFYATFNTACSRVTEVECSESSTAVKAVCTCEITTDPPVCGLSGERTRVFRTADFVKHASGWHMSLRPPD